MQEGGQGEIYDKSVYMLPADHPFIIGIVKNQRHDRGCAPSKAVSLRKIESTPLVHGVILAVKLNTHPILSEAIESTKQKEWIAYSQEDWTSAECLNLQ